MDKKTNMSRAAFLPSPIDPFVLLYFLKYFYSVWQDEVDKLYVCLNSDVEEEVVYELLRLLKHPKIVVSYHDHILGHGKAINLMLDQCSEDNIVLLEDDSIIFKKGIVNKYFSMIESGEYDLIGSPRMSCSLKLANELAKEFNLDYEGFGDKGPNFWPCFLWIKKSDLLKTDCEFGNTEWGDTFVWSSIQLRRMGLRVLEIPQYHLKPDDQQYQNDKLSIFDGKCGYMHIGSLSSGTENTILDSFGKPLKERTKNVPPVKLKTNLTEMEKIELERRVVFWKQAYINATESGINFGEFGEMYALGINNLIETCGLDLLRILKTKSMYFDIINS